MQAYPWGPCSVPGPCSWLPWGKQLWSPYHLPWHCASSQVQKEAIHLAVPVSSLARTETEPANERETEQREGRSQLCPSSKIEALGTTLHVKGIGGTSLLKVLVNIWGQTHSQLITESSYRAVHCPRACRKTEDMSSFYLGTGGNDHHWNHFKTQLS